MAANGSKLVLVGASATMGTEALKMALVDQQWNSQTFVGGAIVFTALAGLSEIAPQPAGMFAVLIMVTILIKDGAPVINKLLNASGSDATVPTTGTITSAKPVKASSKTTVGASKNTTVK